ncbi:putative MFS family arabinose efflux permease [Mesorhizobium sp. J18]|uniref:MFS transporter n=1 Tax=Mesorhizobium sp. J18 TaxID=935263 RepID=UPI00119BD69E|nr:MFS transporter [Mesorhizobium sp. J18]TWG97468.1 putative MFS family arabinose efflux permease [Mesorhizobium sp. J18]
MTKIVQSTALNASSIPAAAYLLTGCISVIGSNSLVLAPIAPKVARSLDAALPMVMWASAAFGLGTALSALFLARYIDRMGAWCMLRLAFAALAAALAGSAVAPGLAILVVMQFAAGLCAGIALPAIYSNAAAIAPQGRESATIGVVLTGWTLSIVAGVSLSTVVADHLGWRAVYGGVAMLAATALAALWRGGYRDRPTAHAAPSPLVGLSVPGVVPLLLACGAFMSAFYGVYGYLGDHLVNGLGHPVRANGLAAIAYGAGFGGAAFLDHIVDRLGARRVMPFAFTAVAGVYVAMMFSAGSFALLLALLFAWGLTNHFGLNVLIMRLGSSDPEKRGTIMGLNSAVTYLAVFVGTLGFGPLYSTSGFSALTGLAAALTLAAALAAAWR